MKRRKFIKQTTASLALASVGSLTLKSCETKTKHITILHTNDTHSQIEPFDTSHYKFANKGGVARRASLVQKVRKENPNTLLLDAGDIFQGTPYFNYFGGEIEFKLMSLLKYDAATLGNHDFDNSIEGFHHQLPNANFDFVCENCDLIICLSHLGYHYKNSDKISDLKLAAATKNIDLIIGGHTHTFLPKPTLVKNASDENVLVNQVGAYGVHLGRVDFYFDEQHQRETSNKTIIL